MSEAEPTTIRWRAVLWVLIVIGVVVLAHVVGVPDQGAIQQRVTDAGAAGPLLLIAGYAAWSLLPVPRNVATIVAGAVFGLAGGAVVAWLGSMIGALVAYGLSRWLGRDTVERLLRGRLDAVNAAIAQRGFVAVVIARLLPVVPFTAVSYGAGVSAVSTPAYVAGTALGTVPGTIAYVAVGAYGSTDPTATGIAIAAALILSVGGWLITRHRRTPPPQTGAPRVTSCED